MSPSANRPSLPDLWTYACQRYPAFKTPLLEWQRKGLSVNDVLLLSYARCHGLGIDEAGWYRIAQARPRRLLERVRRYRMTLNRESPLRATALVWELELERLDLQRLALNLIDGSGAAQPLPPNAQHIRQEDRQRLEALITRLSKAGD
ncbi:MAG: DUF2390 domain-containing protein [Saccharospirillum sp.]